MSTYIIMGCAWIIREIHFHYLTHKLINKVMSRDYGEYRWNENSGKIKAQPKVMADDGISEDLSILDGIG